MKEEEWLSSIDPLAMLDYVLDYASNRKLQLLGGACLRASWDLLGDIRSRRAVEMTERFADGFVSASELALVESEAYDVRNELWDSGNRDDRVTVAEAAAWISSGETWSRIRRNPVRFENYPYGNPLPIHCDLMRDLFGNPFRIIFFDSALLTSDVVNLTDSIYQSNDFKLLPILANAIEEAGCEDPSILDHCRSVGFHARGCWVLDVILGKK